MSSKLKDVSSNLFTLNESLKFGDHLRSDQSSIMEDPKDTDTLSNGREDKEELHRLNEQVESLKSQLGQLKLKNKELKDYLEISQLHNKKHQEKQRELIKKLSHQQITNKQLEFQIRKANEEALRLRDNARHSDNKNVQVSNSLKRAQEERSIFIQSFKKIADAITKCERVQQFQSSVGKFLQYIRKNIKVYESTDPGSQVQFDLRFQLDQIGSLKAKNTELQAKITKLKQELQKERLEKKKLSLTYNEKVIKLKDQCDQLRDRLNSINNQISARENEVQMEINTLKKTISQKNGLISDLKYRIDSEKKARDSVASKKSRVRKRSYYISDGEREPGSHPISEIENQIEVLERQIIQAIQDFKE